MKVLAVDDVTKWSPICSSDALAIRDLVMKALVRRLW